MSQRCKVPFFVYCRFLVVWVIFFQGTAYASETNALLDYIKKPDPAYQYQYVKNTRLNGTTVHLIKMDSQRWRKDGEVNRTLWSHWMTIAIPDKVVSDTAMLIVSGGNNSQDAPKMSYKILLPSIYIAKSTGSVVIMLGQVPNQPLLFSEADKPLREDGLIAYSWRKALDTKDPGWHAYLPMVKSVVRAMDTTQDYLKNQFQHSINHFVVTGFSKRGAATWLTAAVDKRIRAIAPGVYDVLNFSPSLRNHFNSYGYYSDALDDYTNAGILARMYTKMGATIRKIIDPYNYVNNLHIPVFILNSSGDEFFPSDSARYYFNDLPSDRLLRVIPNTRHSLKENNKGITGAVGSLLAWYQTVITNRQRPRIRWRIVDNHLMVSSDMTPVKVHLWQNSNQTRRDFRLQTTGTTWKASALKVQKNGKYTIRLDVPSKGWRAYFLELDYDGVNGDTQTYTTRVFVIPDKYPQADNGFDKN